MGNWRLIIFFRLFVCLVRPHHDGVRCHITMLVPKLHAFRKLHGGFVAPLRVAVLLLVALARSVELPGHNRRRKFCSLRNQPHKSPATLLCRIPAMSHLRNLQRRCIPSRRRALGRYTCGLKSSGDRRFEGESSNESTWGDCPVAWRGILSLRINSMQAGLSMRR